MSDRIDRGRSFVRTFRAVVCFVAVFAGCISFAWAQSANSEISGTIVDQSGAPIPGVEVVATDAARGINYKGQTDSAGIYVIPQIIPGRYDLRVSHLGFTSLEKGGLILRTGDHLSLNLSLKVANASEKITVEADFNPLTISSEQTSTSMTLDNKMITELPQLNRSSLDLAGVIPAVQGGGPLSIGSLGTSAFLIANNGTSFSVAGGQVNGTTISVDGTLVQDQEYNTPNRAIPTPDAIGEFRVESGVLTADHGRFSGGIISLNTQSGTNVFHGRLFEYFRNQAMNANDWSNNASGVPLQAFHQNNYGLGLGGPVRIPRVYKGTDRTFFYFGWEGERFSQAYETESSVPTALNHQGDFSQTVINVIDGTPVHAKIYDPFNGYTLNGNWVRPEYPNDTIPVPGTCVPVPPPAAPGNCFTTQSTLFQNYMNLFPMPNHAPDANSDHANNFWQSIHTTRPSDRFFLRIDHVLTEKQRFSASVSESGLTNTIPAAFAATTRSLTTDRNWIGSGQYTYAISPRSIFEMHLGVSTARLYSEGIIGFGMAPNPSIDTTKWGFDPLIVNNSEKTSIQVPPGLAIPGYTNIGGSGFDTFVNQGVNGNTGFTRVIGRHTLKAGFELYFQRFDENGGDHSGVASVNPGGGSNQFWNNPDGLSGSSLAELMMGSSSFFQWGNWNIAPYGWNEGAYVMDDWKVNSKLVVQLGLRWDHDGARQSRYPFGSLQYDINAKNVLTPNANWDWSQVTSQIPGLSNLASPQWLTQGATGRVVLLDTPDHPQKNLYTTNFGDFQPRLGIAYSLDKNTVLRAGAGIIYQGLGGLSTDFFGFYYNSTTFSQIPSLDGQHWISSISNPFPVQSNGLPLGYHTPVKTNAQYGYQTFGAAANLDNQGTILDHFQSPQEYMWQLSVQRQLSPRWVLTADYTGIRGIHLLMPIWQWSLTNVPTKYYSLGQQLFTQVPNPFYRQSQTFASEPTVPLYQLLGSSPQYTQVSPGQSTWGKSLSHYFTLQIQSRDWHGLTLLGAYSIRKTLTNTGGKDANHPGPVGLGLLQDPHNIMEGYGLALYELPQNFLFNYSYDLPVGHGRQFLSGGSGWTQHLIDGALGGWAIAGVTNFYPKGGPVLMPDVANRVTAPNATVRWSLNPGVDYLNGSTDYSRGIIVNGAFTNPNPQGIFNPTAFARTPDFGLSNAAFIFPNVRNPGGFTTDATILKKFFVGQKDTTYLEFRVEAQNIFNHPNFGGIDNNPDSPTFGGVQGKGGNRIMQLGLRLFF